MEVSYESIHRIENRKNHLKMVRRIRGCPKSKANLFTFLKKDDSIKE
jgi:hypothetical protein